MAEKFDALVLGSGNGGMYLAWHLARTGRRTAVVERQYVGGSCPNINCLPTKNEIWSAKVSELTHRGGQFGLNTGPVSVDMRKVRERKRKMVNDMISAARGQFETSGAQLIMGTGRFVEPMTLEVQLNEGGTRILNADRIFLNLGTRASMPDIPGLDAVKPLTSIEALELDYVPQHLIVIGGGYVGLEMSQIYRRFGSRVTLLEIGAQVGGRVDSDVAAEIQRLFAAEDIEIVVSAELLGLQGRSGKDVRVLFRTATGDTMLEGSDILVATGRIPNTTGIGLEVAGVALDERNYIKVDDGLRTSARNIWAIGECCAGNPQFTHVSFDDFRIIRDNLEGGSRTRQGRLVPHCLFIDPQLAHVGLTESDASLTGLAVRVAKLPMSNVLRAHTTGETQGFMKILVRELDDEIVGFTMLGAEASEVVSVVQMAMLAHMPYPALRDALIAHPTMSEGLGPLLSNVSPSSARK